MKSLRILYVIAIGVCLFAQSPHTASAQLSCDSFTVTPTTALVGDNVTLDWLTTDAASVNIDPIGPVSTSGSLVYVVPDTPGILSFNLEATDGAVFEPSFAYCSADLTVLGPPTCDYFFATPDTLSNAGDVVLEWSTTGADISVSIDNGIGAVTEFGTLTVPVSEDTTFILTAEGTNGTTQCSAPVTVNSVEAEEVKSGAQGGGKSINPRCEIRIDKAEVLEGDTVNVSWKSANAQSFSLMAVENGQSKVLFSTSSAALGSFAYVVTGDTTFKAEVTRPNRLSECDALVTVKADDFNGAVAGDNTGLISLALMPATGFDPTPEFVIIFNAFIIFGAAMGAYVIVIFSQQYRRAVDRSFARTHIYTPLQVRFLQERQSLHSRIVLWKWLAVLLLIVLIALYVRW